MPRELSFRDRLDDYLICLACGELDTACREHYAEDIAVYENGVAVAHGRPDALRKLRPITRRYAMLRGTLDGLDCDRVTGEVRFVCRFDGVDIDGRLVRDVVRYR